MIWLYTRISFCFSEHTQAKYQEVLQNSGLFHIDGEVDNEILILFLKEKKKSVDQSFSNHKISMII